MHDRERIFIPYGRKPADGSARVDLRMIAFFAIVLLLLALAGWLYLRQASQVAELASEIRELELAKEARHREIVILRGQVAMLGSLKRVMLEGSQMGYRLPAASGSDQQLVIPCLADCTPPGVAGVEQAPDASGMDAASDSFWAQASDRLRNWMRLAFPGW